MMDDAAPISLLPPWSVDFDNIPRIDPNLIAVGSPKWDAYGSKMLMARNPDGWWLEVSWSPERDPAGSYVCAVIKGSDWADPASEVSTRSVPELLDQVRELSAARVDDTQSPAARWAHVANSALTGAGAVSAVDSIAEIGGASELIELIDSDRPEVRQRAVEHVANMGLADAGPALMNRFILPDDNMLVRGALVSALGALRHTPAVPALVRWLRFPNRMQRKAAAAALAQIGGDEARQGIEAAIAAENRDETRKALMGSLAKLADT